MKRFLLSALLLALLAAFPASAEELPLFLLEQNGACIGSAVMFGTQNTLLTTAPLSGSDEVLLITEDGKIPLEVYSDPDNMLSILVSLSPLSGTPVTFGTVTVDAMTASGFLPDGTPTQGGCRYAAYLTEPAGLTLSTVSRLLPGAALTNANGDLCGIIAASLGEGEGRYYALSSVEIYDRLTQKDVVSLENIDFIDFTATVDGLHVLLDWSDAPQAREDGMYCVYWADTANTYYTYHTVQSCTDSIPCVPGRSYVFCVREIASEHDDLSLSGFPDGQDPIQVPGGKKVERYHFLDTDVYLACLGENETAEETELLPAVTDFSAVFTHEGQDLYLQVTSTYEVTEEIEAYLTCALYAPDGSCYYTLSGFIFAPEYMAQDCWHMDVTELFDNCLSSVGAQSGIYLLRYYLDDELASEITFEIP